MKKIFALFVTLAAALVLAGCSRNTSAVSPAENALEPDWGITLSVQNATPTGVTLVIAQSGGDPTIQLSYGREYALEVLKDGGWEAVPYIVDDLVVWTTEAIIVNREDSTENYINFENLYGNLSAGKYRIAKSFNAATRKGGYDTHTLFAEFEITGEYASEKQDYIAALQSWNLNIQMKVSELSEIVQNYLNENYDGLQINSKAFQKFVLEMFSGDSYPLAKMAEENSEFGALYLYMCIYYDENISDDSGYFTNAAEQPLSAETMKMTLGEVFDADFKQNHQESSQSVEPTINKNMISAVMVDGILYYDTGEKSNAEARCGMMDGEITASVDRTDIPTKNNQSNFGTGYAYQRGTEGTLEICINGEWIIYAAENAVQSGTIIPQSVP